MGPAYHRFARKVNGINLPGKCVMDIGTGSGLLAIELAKGRPDWQISGIDISEEMLKLAQQNAARNGFADKIDFHKASAAALPFPDGSFDLMASHASFHLWKDPLKVFKEIARVTAPGGYCCLWDTLRLTAFLPLVSLAGWVAGMNSAQRQLWLRAVRSSYTLRETMTIIKESALKGARVKFIPIFFILSIEWRKP
jgi:ubiquinone/menaquinone biosynthesis C-methylase UbiE